MAIAIILLVIFVVATFVQLKKTKVALTKKISFFEEWVEHLEEENRVLKLKLLQVYISKECLCHLSDEEGQKYFPPDSVDDIGFNYNEGWHLINPSAADVIKAEEVLGTFNIIKSSRHANVHKLLNI